MNNAIYHLPSTILHLTFTICHFRYVRTHLHFDTKHQSYTQTGGRSDQLSALQADASGER